MYLDNSLNKLLPSCLLLPLLLRVISVLIVFLSIWSHCFLGLFLCYFLNTKINYEHPSELCTRNIHTSARQGCPVRGQEFLPSPGTWQLLTVCWECDNSWCLGGNMVSFQHHSSNWKLKVSRTHILLCSCWAVYLLGSLQHLTCHGKWAQPGLNVSNSIHSQNSDRVNRAQQPVHGKPRKLVPFSLLLPRKWQAHFCRLNAQRLVPEVPL